MTSTTVMELLLRTFELAVLISGPLLGAGMVVGLGIAVLQAATQVQESSLNFVPKILAMGVVVLVMGPWLLSKMVQFAAAVLGSVATIAPGVGG